MVPASTRVPSRSRITPVGGPGSTESAACRSSESTVAVTRAGPAWLPRVTSTRAIPVETVATRSEEHTSELQSPCNIVCRLLLEKKKHTQMQTYLPRLDVGVRTQRDIGASQPLAGQPISRVASHRRLTVLDAFLELTNRTPPPSG